MNRRRGVQIIPLITILLFIFSTLSYTVQSAPPVSQETIVVDINGNGDYTSIKEAITNADPTNIILIQKGVYNEHAIEVNKKLEIIGEDSSNTIINCSGNLGLILSSTYVDISNLQIINTGEYAISILPESGGCTISNCVINTLNKGVAIDIRSSYNSVSDCSLSGFNRNKQGIKIHGSNNNVKNCNINDFSNGILVLLESNNNNISNCNIINNENAIDFRLNSNNNIISNCNIYSNLQGIKIWQNSNNNIIYLNNLWKNDIDAIDKENNTWDNGAQGNYWDKYEGRDNNIDNIGDTPYIISEENKDRFPLMNVVLPDAITLPANVKHITSKSDNTPSFTWSPSIYSKGIKGYYVKIDNNPEIYIGDITSWAISTDLSDGVHTFYVKAIGNDNSTSDYATAIFSIDVSFIDTDEDGWSDEDEQLYGTNPNDADNYPSDTDNDRIPNSVDTDDDNDDYTDDMELSYGTNPENSNDYPIDTDDDGIPDEGSPDGKFIGDIDDDDDGLMDTIEKDLGSNPQNELDVIKIYITGKPYYLVDATQNGFYDILYEPTEDTTSGIEKQDENYLIDINNDGYRDYIYSTIDGSISTYEEQTTLTLAIWIFLPLTILFIISIIILYYRRSKPRKYTISKKARKDVERPSIKKPLRIHAGDKKDTVEMIRQTRTLLQHIQQDVEVYMEKLYQIEDQITVTSTETEEETTSYFEEKTSESNNVRDIEPKLDDTSPRGIESKVDELLSMLDNKDKN